MATTLARPYPALRAGSNPELAAPSMHHPVFVLRPGYERVGAPVVVTGRAPVAEPPGTILALRLDRPCVDPHAVEQLTREISRRAPTCPVVVLLRMSPEDALLTAVRLASLRIRAVVPEVEPLRPLLVPLLTDPATLPRGAVAWLQDRGIRLSPNTAALVEGILADAPTHATLGSLLDQLHVPISSARFRMRKKGLPAPGRWFQAGRALHAALLLQAHPEASTATIAQRLGFADHSALAHLLRRTFRVKARAIRETLGWEWLLHRWLTR